MTSENCSGQTVPMRRRRSAPSGDLLRAAYKPAADAEPQAQLELLSA